MSEMKELWGKFSKLNHVDMLAAERVRLMDEPGTVSPTEWPNVDAFFAETPKDKLIELEEYLYARNRQARSTYIQQAWEHGLSWLQWHMARLETKGKPEPMISSKGVH